MSVKERIISFINSEEISVSSFEKSTGLSNGFVKNIGKSIGMDKLEKILNSYRNLNGEWLMTGEGSMLKASSDESPKATIVWDETERHMGVPIYDIDFACSFIEMSNDFSSHPIGWLSLPPFNDPERYAVV